MAIQLYTITWNNLSKLRCDIHILARAKPCTSTFLLSASFRHAEQLVSGGRKCLYCKACHELIKEEMEARRQVLIEKNTDREACTWCPASYSEPRNGTTPEWAGMMMFEIEINDKGEGKTGEWFLTFSLSSSRSSEMGYRYCAFIIL